MTRPEDIPLRLASQLYGELQGLLPDHGMDVFVIGAFAAQLWVDDKGAAPYRGTRDVDIVIGVPSYPDYASVRDELVREWDRVKSLEGRHRLILDDGMKIDLLPLDAYAIQRSGMDFTELWSGPREFVGFAQVATRGTKAYTVDDQTIRSATIPAIVGLKLISLDDRPIHRQKDAHDIGEIVLRYRDLENDNVWDHH